MMSRKIFSINPATSQVLKTYNEATVKDIETAISRSHKSFRKWKTTSFSERSKLILSLAENLRRKKDELARTITLEMGKSIREARTEIGKCASACDYYAIHTEKFLADEVIATDAGKSFVAYSPLGIILAVMPWNFPFWQVLRFAVPTIMAGNTVILKHASNVPQCGIMIQKLFKEAGFNEGVFQNLLISASKVKYLILDSRIMAVTLTGSELAGSNVASLAGENIKKTVLELGGSDPFIVLKEADIEAASTVAVQSRMINNGQSCIAAKRFIVVKDIMPKFINGLKSKMGKIKIGNPMDEQFDYGPLARKDLADVLLRQVKSSVKKGAKVILGGDKILPDGAFF